MFKAISFLGTTDYAEVTYVYDGEAKESRFFPATLPHFFPDLDRVLVFVTPTVQQHPNLVALRACLGSRLEPVPIPEGQSEEELWQTFDAITEAVTEHDRVLFDITHSFRSIPLLTFLAASYLRVVRQIEVDHVVYGAFDARDRETNRTPVFDLTPFVTLLDWLTATDRFIDVGDGRPLAALLRQSMPPGPAMGEHPEVRAVGNQLKHAADAIAKVSLALSVSRPLEAMEAAVRLEDNLRQARDAVAARAQPFALLADQVRDSYAPFALAEPLDEGNWRANLRVQLAMIRWYLDKELIVQAATLAREWVVSLVACCVGAGSLIRRPVRGRIEGALNNTARRAAGRCINRPSCFDDSVSSLPVVDTLSATWNTLRNMRNDLAHVGMNERPKSAEKLQRAMDQLYPALAELAAELLDADPSAEES